jgi:formylglycine-generating enzyme required for sulfatase activity
MVRFVHVPTSASQFAQELRLSLVVCLICFLSVTAGRAAADTFGIGANSFDIDFVTIGNPGNAADTTGSPNPAGSVPYEYRIGKYEISEQMIDKANALGGLGITKDTRGADKPATSLNWYEAARFVNWLNLSTGSPLAYKFTLQPGDAGYNAHFSNMQLWTISDAGYDPNNSYRNSLARYFLPSVDEWYKAAYYDPTSGVYYDYPTGSDTLPDGIDFAGDANFEAVYFQSGSNPEPNDITNVGVLSPYGTAGQGGNVFEWEETEFDLVNDVTSSDRGDRGGGWSSNSVNMRSLNRNAFTVVQGPPFIGFRVASIPEPNTLLLAALAGLGLLGLRRGFLGAFIVALSIIISVADRATAVAIETIPVGNPGNANDPATGNVYGGVNYAYNIGKYEVTVGQYTAFLNAVAATDTYGLYNTSLATNLNIAGISRTGVSGSYSYSVIGSGNHPVTFVSWGDAARFANWLHNGQPTDVQGPGTTETGAYTLNGATSNSALMAVIRNASATWAIPTENEWYKSAYYQPTAQGGDSDGYWDYPMKTNSRPYSDEPPGATPDNTRVGNFDSNDGIDNGYNDGLAVTGSTYSNSQNYLTDVGAYTSSPSYYGTFDQGGNVWEWTETALPIMSADRVIRGGGWSTFAEVMSAFPRGGGEPLFESVSTGFRVTSIPEPSTLLLGVVAGLGLLLRRHRMNILVNSLLSTRCLCLAMSFIAVGGVHAQSPIVFMTAAINPTQAPDSELVRFDSGTQSFMTDTSGFHGFDGVTILNGEVLVADPVSGQIQRFDPDGSDLGLFASPGEGARFLESDSHDNVYASGTGGPPETPTGHAVRFNSAGAVTGTFFVPGAYLLNGIDADASGNVYVVNQTFFDPVFLYKFASDGTFLNSIPVGYGDISIDEVNQRLYLAEGFRIGIYDISGTVPVLAGTIATPVNSSIYRVHYAAESGNVLATDLGDFSGDPRGLEYSPLGTLVAEYRPINAYSARDIVTMVPEPGSMGLVSLAFVGIGLTRRPWRR